MKYFLVITISSLLLITSAFANNDHGHEMNAKVCEHFGPQTPRDIDNMSGKNSITFNLAPPASDMNLCNIHFHENAEHKAKDFSIYAGEGHNGYNSGYQCGMSKNLTKAELAPTKEKICNGKHGDLQPGDTIEVHWVHTSCDVQPGPSLSSCVSDACANPDLRVETQVFTLVNDANALNFNELKLAKDLPSNTGNPVEFTGSTTGPKYSEQSCSPYQVTWSVRPKCAKLDINSVGQWCKGNVFKEDHAHGVRKLVSDPKLLSEIK